MADRADNEELAFSVEVRNSIIIREIITAFTTTPVQCHCHHVREVIVETDALDYVSTKARSQYNNEGVLHQVVYFSKKHTLAECNDIIYEAKLKANIIALEEWRPECEEAA